VAFLLSQLKTPCPAQRRLPALSIFSYTHNYYKFLYLLYLFYNNISIIDRPDAYRQFATQTALSLLISQFEVGLSF
jgi:hypothetical protein